MNICMNHDKLQSIALQFNTCITNADIEGLTNLMTENHVFIDMDNNRIEGKSNCISTAWRPFFSLFPVYQNIFEKVYLRGNDTVIMQGYSICTNKILNNVKAIWMAKITENKVSLWHIYPDTEEIRNMLNI